MSILYSNRDTQLFYHRSLCKMFFRCKNYFEKQHKFNHLCSIYAHIGLCMNNQLLYQTQKDGSVTSLLHSLIEEKPFNFSFEL